MATDRSPWGGYVIAAMAMLAASQPASGTLAGLSQQPDLTTPVGERQPLIEAVRQYNIAELNVLIGGGAMLDAVDPLGRTALHYAAALEQVDAVMLLLSAGASADTADNDGYTPLHRAAASGSAVIISLLLDAGADPHWRGPHGQTAIEIARTLGLDDIVSILEGDQP